MKFAAWKRKNRGLAEGGSTSRKVRSTTVWISDLTPKAKNELFNLSDYTVTNHNNDVAWLWPKGYEPNKRRNPRRKRRSRR